MATLDDLRAGISIEDALDAFRAGCNRPNETLWITESWITPRFEKLRAAITGPLTEEQAELLRNVVLKRADLDRVIDWVSEHSDISYKEYSRRILEAAKQRELAAARHDYDEWRSAITGTPLPSDQEHRFVLSGGLVYPVIERRITEPKEPREQYLDRATPCPLCGTTADRLTWTHIYLRHVAMPNAGRAWEGWMTVCEPCAIRVNTFARTFEIY